MSVGKRTKKYRLNFDEDPEIAEGKENMDLIK